MVIWIVGLSGTGKTTLATHVVEQIRQLNGKVVLLDGDVIRTLFGNDVDHTINGRLKNAERLSVLTKFLADQGIHVVAAVLSIFPEWRRWNRENIPDYSEVYLKASMQTLLRRDIKDLYAKAIKGEILNVVGVDIPFPEPVNPELVIENDIDLVDFQELTARIMNIAAVQKALGNA
ncbi:adenylyl-sulfate kinase [Methylomonas methanica]|uniref:Adenylylsulfate kinase n=1 Tax=Methylomonas methanica (strain DSM 25384 / MC09) TaxID=857087 RepID=F9ZWD7_METMM|nr:adenylyl-sulfate kinase [Methylomonas methanica]AEF99606.1 adenylylsulfate kinase [Methylomonas methanica MC09]